MKVWWIALCLLSPLASLMADELDHADHHPAMPVATATTRVSLSAEGPVSPGQDFSLKLAVKSSDGQPLDFEVFQEQRLHLIVVSSNLVYFKHLHPDYLGNGVFRLRANLPFGGAYRLFLDYRPSGLPEQVKELSLSLPGSRPKASLPDPSITTRSIDDLDVSLAGTTVKAGETVRLDFNLSRAGQPVEQLEPYLGERGHLVIIRRSQEGNEDDYLHAHALKGGGPVSFMTSFDEPGLYKLWFQFKLAGAVKTADFWIKAE